MDNTRETKMLGLCISAELYERLEQWRTRQKPWKPTKTACIELALKEFLDKRDPSERSEVQ